MCYLFGTYGTSEIDKTASAISSAAVRFFDSCRTAAINVLLVAAILYVAVNRWILYVAVNRWILYVAVKR
jgi:hypothetical protein